MSWKASAHVKELTICPNGERITRSEKLLAMVLADYHQVGRPTYPAIASLAEDALMDLRQAQRLLASLEKKGVLIRDRPAKQGRGQTTHYSFPGIENFSKEGWQDVTLSSGPNAPPKGDISTTERAVERAVERVTFSDEKGGKKGDIFDPPIEEQELKKNKKQQQQGAVLFRLRRALSKTRRK